MSAIWTVVTPVEPLCGEPGALLAAGLSLWEGTGAQAAGTCAVA